MKDGYAAERKTTGNSGVESRSTNGNKTTAVIFVVNGKKPGQIVMHPDVVRRS